MVVGEVVVVAGVVGVTGGGVTLVGGTAGEVGRVEVGRVELLGDGGLGLAVGSAVGPDVIDEVVVDSASVASPPGEDVSEEHASPSKPAVEASKMRARRM